LHVTASSVIMIVVHFAKVNALYPRIVISSLVGVWPIDHYISLQRFTMGRMPSFAKVVRSTIALLRFPRVVTVPRPLLHRVSVGE
jgi:hypothetical protein